LDLTNSKALKSFLDNDPAIVDEIASGNEPIYMGIIPEQGSIVISTNETNKTNLFSMIHCMIKDLYLESES
jgi:hypothetical protein